MFTVIDQQSAWLAPSRRFAATTQPHDGATRMRTGTGMPSSQPTMSTRRRPTRSATAPAATLISALDRPKLAMNESTAGVEERPNCCVPTSGSTVRSRPTIAPTNALRRTRIENWPRLARNPSLTLRS